MLVSTIFPPFKMLERKAKINLNVSEETVVSG